MRHAFAHRLLFASLLLLIALLTGGPSLGDDCQTTECDELKVYATDDSKTGIAYFEFETEDCLLCRDPKGRCKRPVLGGDCTEKEKKQQLRSVESVSLLCDLQVDGFAEAKEIVNKQLKWQDAGRKVKTCTGLTD